MPANHYSNAVYEKVSLLDEFDENEKWTKKAPIDESDINGNDVYQNGSLVSL